MPNPWDVPWSAPLRPGDRTEEIIFLAVGRALTKWEGLEAGMASLFAVLTGGADSWLYIPAVRAYGAITSANSRADMILQAGRAFFHHFEYSGTPHAETEPREANLKDIIKHYNGWMGRRNDVAHGYVTAAQHPDYERNAEDTVTTYQLCPSHSNSRKWPLWTPIVEHPRNQYKAVASGYSAIESHRWHGEPYQSKSSNMSLTVCYNPPGNLKFIPGTEDIALTKNGSPDYSKAEKITITPTPICYRLSTIFLDANTTIAISGVIIIDAE